MEKLSRFRPLPDPRLPPMVGCAMCHLKLDTIVFTTPVFFLCFFFSITNESLQKQEEELKRVSASLFLDVFSLLPDDDDHRRRRHSTASSSITLNVQNLTFSTP